MTENKASKVLAYISAALSGIFILLTADVIVFQKKYAELCGVTVDNIETAGTAVPYSAIAYLIFAAVLSLRPVCNIIQSRLTAALSGSEALADYGIVSGYCGNLDFLLYIGVTLAVCVAARNMYAAKGDSLTDETSEFLPEGKDR